MSESDFIVIRDPDRPHLSGKWFDLTPRLEMPRPKGSVEGAESIEYVPTPFIETRDDGAVAQVYMLRLAPASRTERE